MHDFRLWRDLACTPSRPQHLVPDLAFTPSPAKAEESGTIANTCLALSRRGGGPVLLRHPVLLAAQPHPVFVGTGWPPHRGASRHPGVERTRCGAGLDTWCGAGWTPRVEWAGHPVRSGAGHPVWRGHLMYIETPCKHPHPVLVSRSRGGVHHWIYSVAT